MTYVNEKMLNGTSDIYYSNCIAEYVECSNQFCNIKNTSTKGFTRRNYRNDGTVIFESLNGDYTQSRMKHHSIRTKIKNYSNLNIKKGDIQIDYISDNEIFNSIDYVGLFKVINEYAESNNILLKKIFLQNENEYYEYLNSYGTLGNGIRRCYSPGILVQSQKAVTNMLYYKTVIHEDIENCLKDMIDKITEEKEKISLDIEKTKWKFTFCSSELFSRLLRCFFDVVVKNKSNITRLSTNLNIVENSVRNKSLISNIDGEGHIRDEYYIIKDGNLVNSLSDMRDEKIIGRGSSVRKNYSMLPTTNPSKIFVNNINSISFSELSLKENTLFIENIQGLEESFNTSSMTFDAIVSYNIRKDGIIAQRGQYSTSCNVIEILKRIICFSEEINYEVAGNMLLPGVLIEGVL